VLRINSEVMKKERRGRTINNERLVERGVLILPNRQNGQSSIKALRLLRDNTLNRKLGCGQYKR